MPVSSRRYPVNLGHVFNSCALCCVYMNHTRAQCVTMFFDSSQIYLLIVSDFSGTLIAGSALECYVCSNQTDNTEKCLNTIRTCEQGEDVCLTEIRWGSQPYFSQGALKQYYVSKRCSTKQLCQRIRSKYMPYCTHIWYEDWTCSECCQGDRCNYFVIVSIPQCWHCDNSHEFTCFFFLSRLHFRAVHHDSMGRGSLD